MHPCNKKGRLIMKKLLCVLCAIAICLSFTTIAFAQETDVIVDSQFTGDLSQEDLEELYKAAEKIAEEIIARWDVLADQSGGITLSQLIDKVADAIASKFAVAGGTIITSAIADKVKEILIANGFDPETVKVVEPENFDSLIDTIFEEIGKKYGEDTVDTIYDFICKSDLVNWFANLYVSQSTTQPETTVTTTTQPDPTTTVDPIDIPSTSGDVSIFAGVAVLVVAAAAAVVCTKKAKKDEE